MISKLFAKKESTVKNPLVGHEKTALSVTSALTSGIINSTFKSSEVADAIVQGTLISHLHVTMNPRMRETFAWAKLLNFLGAILVIVGLFVEGQGILAVMLNDFPTGALIEIFIPAIVNKMLIAVCFVDCIFQGVVRLRLFNGYMPDDIVLTSFCKLIGFESEIKKYYAEGKDEEKEEREAAVAVGDVEIIEAKGAADDFISSLQQNGE